MNTALLLRIRDWLLNADGSVWDFDMNTFIRAQATEDGWCGTACCIAGAALILEDPDYVTDALHDKSQDVPVGYEFECDDPVEELAAELLDLDRLTAEHLFFPWSTEMGDPLPDDLSRSLAARVIENLIETGAVNWRL